MAWEDPVSTEDSPVVDLTITQVVDLTIVLDLFTVLGTAGSSDTTCSFGIIVASSLVLTSSVSGSRIGGTRTTITTDTTGILTPMPVMRTINGIGTVWVPQSRTGLRVAAITTGRSME